jgi:hypothetical protein
VKNRLIVRRVLVLTMLMVSLNFGVTTNAAAETRPTIQLIEPTPTSLVTPDAPFKITIRVTGGWVSKAIKNSYPCGAALFSDENPKLLTYIGAVDAAGTTKAMYETGGGGNIFPFLFTASKILDDAVECTFNAGSNIYWEDGGRFGNEEWIRTSKAIQYGGLRMAKDATTYGPVKKISIAWAWEDEKRYTFSTIGAGESAIPKFSFIGIKQGDVIEGPTPFTVEVEIGKTLTPTASYSPGAACGVLNFKSENLTHNKYESSCILNPAPLSDEIYILEFQFQVNTTGFYSFKSEAIKLNVGDTLKLGKPWLRLSVSKVGIASNSGLGNQTSHAVTFEGNLVLRKYSSSNLPIPNQKFTICLNQNCGESITDQNGNFTYDVVNLGTSPIYTFTGAFRGIPITKDNYELGEKNNFSPIAYSFTIPEKLEPKPELKLTHSTVHVIKPPTKVKWGKSFTVSIATKGTGGAICEMHFQNPGWPSRKGITPFRLEAGSTTKITVKPWIRLFASYSLKYVCIPDGWPRMNSDNSISLFDKRVGGNMGNVTLVP